MYVKTLATLRFYHGKNLMMLYAINPVTDYNEVTNHFLNVFLNHCIRTKGYIIE